MVEKNRSGEESFVLFWKVNISDGFVFWYLNLELNDELKTEDMLGNHQRIGDLG